MLTRRRLAAAVVVGTLVSAVAIGMLFTRKGVESYDDKIMLEVTDSMLSHGNFLVKHDEFGRNTPYSSYGLGMSLLFAGPFEVAKLAHGNTSNAVMTTNAYVFGAAAIALLALSRRLGLSWGKALVATFLLCTGTMLLPYVPTGFSELAVGATVAVGLLAIMQARQHARWAGLVGGLAAGGAVLLRTDSIVLVVPAIGLGVWLAGGRKWRIALDFGLAILPFLVFLAWYNNLRFGSPFKLGYAKDNGFTYPFWLGLHGLLISPGRGVVWYVPLLAVAVIGGPWAWKRDPVLTAAAAFILVSRPLFYASWAEWQGGVCWGPRFLVPAMPALAVGVVEVVRRFGNWRIPIRLLVGLVMALSIAVQLVGTTIGYEFSWNFIRPTAVARGETEAYLYSWKYLPIRDEARWVFTRTDLYVGRALPPSKRPKLFTGLLLLGLAGTAVAIAGARRLDRHQPGLPGAPPGDGLPQPAQLIGATKPPT